MEAGEEVVMGANSHFSFFLPCFALIFINNYYKLLCAEVGPSDKQIKSHRFTKAAPVELNSVPIVIVVLSNVNIVLNCLDV